MSAYKMVHRFLFMVDGVLFAVYKRGTDYYIQDNEDVFGTKGFVKKVKGVWEWENEETSKRFSTGNGFEISILDFLNANPLPDMQ